MVFAILGRNSDAFAKVLQLELPTEPRASTEDEVIPEDVQQKCEVLRIFWGGIQTFYLLWFSLVRVNCEI